jgi:glutamate-ammonia-ligase adenylyltransferase
MGRNDIEAVKMALAKMRSRIARIKGAGLAWDIKDGAGRLQDIELISQLGRLLNGGAQRDVSSGLKACARSGVLNDAERRAIDDAYKLLWSLRVAAKLLGQSSFDQSTMTGGTARFLKALTGHIEFEALKRDLAHKSEQVADILNRVLPEAQDDDDER